MDDSEQQVAGEERADDAAAFEPSIVSRAQEKLRRAIAHRAAPPVIVLAVFMLIGLFALLVSSAGNTGPAGAADNVGGSIDSSPAGAPSGEAGASISRFGVVAPASAQPAPIVKELGGGWVRINYTVKNGNGPDLQPYLDAGLNIILTLNYADADNVDNTYGTTRQWPQAGFPYKSRDLYQEQLHSVLSAYDDPLRKGRIWLQCENEVADAAQVPDSTYWRGTDDQYLKQLQTFYEAVKSINPDIPVVLAGVQSTALDAAYDQAQPNSPTIVNHLDKLLQFDYYDVADLHFYGCASGIPAKIGSINSHMQPGKSWISTENGGPDSRCKETPLGWDANPQQFEQLQAQLVGQRLKACADGGGKICLWFSLLDMPNESPVFSHLGLIDATGAQPRRKPAFDAFRNFVAAYGKPAAP